MATRFDTSSLRPIGHADDSDQPGGTTPRPGRTLSAGGLDLSGLRPADAPDAPRNAMAAAITGQQQAGPGDNDGLLATGLNYASEFGKGVVRGAANLGGLALKFGGAVQTVMARDMRRFAEHQLDVQARIDRGDQVEPRLDVYGYASMSPHERQATRQRLTSRLTDFDLPGGAADRDLYKAGEFVSDAGRRVAPVGPGFKESTTAALGEGVGSVVAGLPIAAAGPGAAAIAYGSAGGGEALDRAIQDGASNEDQLRAAILGVGPGATDVAPLELLLRGNRLTSAVSGPLSRAIMRIGGQAFIEGVQEGGQQFLQNLIAREVYKPEQALGEGILPNTAMGAGVGGIAGLGAELVRLLAGGRRARGGAQEPPPTPHQGAQEPPRAGPLGPSLSDRLAANGIRPGPDGRLYDFSGERPQSVLLQPPQNGATPTNDNANFRELGGAGTGPNLMAQVAGSDAARAAQDAAALRSNPMLPQTPGPDLALSGGSDRLAYGGSGEASNRQRRQVDRSAVEVDAGRLMKSVRAYEDEMQAAGASPQTIADGMRATFGFDVSADDVARRSGWWRLDEAIAQETGRNAKGQFAKLQLPPAARQALLGEWREMSSPVIAKQLSEQFGIDASVRAINDYRVSIGAPSEAKGGTPLPDEITRALWSPRVQAMTPGEAAEFLRQKYGHEGTAHAVTRWRQRRAGTSEDDIAYLLETEYASLSNAKTANALNARFGNLGFSINARAVGKIREARGLKTGNYGFDRGHHIPREVLAYILQQERYRSLPAHEAADLIAREGHPPISYATVQRVRRELGIPTPKNTFRLSPERDRVLAFLQSPEAQNLTHRAAAERMGVERDYVRSLRRTHNLRSGEHKQRPPNSQFTPEAMQFLLSDDGMSFSHRALAAELRRRFPGHNFTTESIRSRRIELGLTDDSTAPDIGDLTRQPAFEGSPYRDATTALEMMTRRKSRRVSDARYASLVEARTGRQYSEQQIKDMRETARTASRQMGSEPLFAIGGRAAPDLTEAERAELLRDWGSAGNEDGSTSLAPVHGMSSRMARSARPIDWASPGVQRLLEGRGRRPSSRGDFAWPPSSLEMIRAAEGKLTFDELARALSKRFGTTITRDMVSGKVRRLRALGSGRVGPMLAATNDAESWLSRFKRSRNARTGEAKAVRGEVDQQGRAIPGRASGEDAALAAGEEGRGPGRARGGVRGFDLGGFRGLAVETLNVHGLRQRRYYLFPAVSELPSQTRSPQVVQRVLKSTRHWVAKAHVSEVSPGEWRVLGVNVRRNRQRRGLGSQLYDALSRDIGVTLGPSPSMSPKLMRFWEKRNRAAIADYQRLGNAYHSPDTLRAMKLANDEILADPLTPRDAAMARRFDAQIREALAKANSTPAWAASDVQARVHVRGFLKAGRTVTIPEAVVSDMLGALERVQGVIPAGTQAGVLVKVRPLKGDHRYANADVEATFETTDGKQFTVDLPSGTLLQARAFYDHFTGAIGFARFGTFSGLDRTLAGEAHHESTHALRRSGALSGPVWVRLVSHANQLRLLDSSLGSYLKMVGDPIAGKVDPTLTVREMYEEIYRDAPDFDERMDQEAVAHMRELYAHGHLLPQEVAPVQDLLDALMAGEIPGQGAQTRAREFDTSSLTPVAAGRQSQDLALSGGRSSVTTPGGEMEIDVAPEVVDLAELRPATGDLQPRDRSRAESSIGARERAAQLDPARLMPERVSDSGAPIVLDDGTVISGNGRVLSIAEAYRSPELAEQADAYRQALKDYAAENGLDVDLDTMREPVLISRIAEDLSRDELARFADLSNRSSIAEMSAPERAARDARAIGPELMGLYQGGDFTSADNREFYRAFMDGGVAPNERGSVSRDGILTRGGEDRMTAAVLAGAYGDPALLSRMLESTDDNIRSITGAMRDASGAFVRLKQGIASGEVDSGFDITPQIAETARRIADLRARRVPLQTFLAQQDAFSRLDPIVEDLLRGFYNDSLTRAHSREKLTELLTSYAEEAVRHKQNGLIPDETTAADVVRYAATKAAKTLDDIIADSTGLARGTHDRNRPADQGRAAAGYGTGARAQANQPLTPSAGQPPIGGNAMLNMLNAPTGAPPPFAPGGGIAPPPVPPAGSPPTVPPLIPRGPQGPRQPPNPAALRAINGWGVALLEYFQNSEERMRRVVDHIGQGRLPDTADPYLRATLYHGRVGARVRYGNDVAEGIIRDIARLARSSRVSHDEMRGLVNDYLIARHAPERNALHGDGAAGISTADAQALMTRIRVRQDAQQIAGIADRVITLHTLSLDALLDADVISQQTHSTLRSTYRHHVPLNRLLPDAENVGGAIAGRGFDVYSSGIRRARGSDLDVDDILGNVLANFEQSMIRSEKNLVDLSSLEFVRRHAADLAGIAREERPPVIGTQPNGQPIYQQSSDPRILHLFEGGRPVWLRFNDPRLAAAFKGSNRESLPSVLRWVAAFTRFYSGLQTRFNPEFALPNKLRDLQETAVYMASQRRIGVRGAARLAARDPASVKAILDHMAGRNTAGARLYAEMVDAGGTTGGMGLSTREQVTINVAKLDRLAESSTRRLARAVVDLVDNWNTIFEDSTRLSVYREARERGLSRERAAFLAKEASINFNRMGTAGPVINGLWMFSNASIQGSVKMIRSLRNPKVAAGVGMAIAAAIVAVTEWNDDLDPDWRDKVSKWDRLNSLPIVLPNENGEGVRYVSIPVSWGLKPLMVAAAAGYDAAKGLAVDWATALSDVLTATIEAYNPLGGTDLGQALTPTIGDTPLDIARNKKWSGNKLRPDQDQNLPADKQYFLSLKDTESGRAAIKATETLQEYTGIEISPADLSYAIEQYAGGAGRFARKSLDTVIGVATANPPPADEFPMLSRFYRERSEEETGRGAGGQAEDVRSRLREQSRERFDQRSRVDDVLRSMEGMGTAQRNRALSELRGDRQLYQDVREGLRQMDRGLTWQDRQVMRLGVENGERARYLAEILEPLPPQQRADKMRELGRKGLLTGQVRGQVMRMLRGAMRGAAPPPPATPGLDTTGLRPVR